MTGVAGKRHDRQFLRSGFSGTEVTLNLRFCRSYPGMEAADYLSAVFLDCSFPCASCLELGYSTNRFAYKVKVRKFPLFGNVWSTLA